MRVRTFLVILATTAIGCAPTMTDADIKQFIAFYDKLVELVLADKDDCSKMATDLDAQIDGHADLIEKLKEAGHHNQRLPAAVGDHMAEGVMRMGDQACWKDKAVQKAWFRLAIPYKK
jgi:hypothetical protein